MKIQGKTLSSCLSALLFFPFFIFSCNWSDTQAIVKVDRNFKTGTMNLFVQESGMYSLINDSTILIMQNGGFQWSLNGTRGNFGDLIQKNSASDQSVVSNEGQIPGTEFSIEQIIKSEKENILFQYQWKEASFNSFLYSIVSLPFVIHDIEKIRVNDTRDVDFSSFSSMNLADNVTKVCITLKEVEIFIESKTPFSLLDARAWKEEKITVTFDLKKFTSICRFGLRLNFRETKKMSGQSEALRYSRLGYSLQGPKVAFFESSVEVGEGKKAWLEDKSEKKVFLGSFKKHPQAFQFFYLIFDFTKFQEEGEYRVVWDKGASDYFPINNHVFDHIWQDALSTYLPFQHLFAFSNVSY